MHGRARLYAGRMAVELRHLRCLVAVVDEGTLTDAGIALGLSQAAVSRTLAGLERELGVLLVRRTSRELSLTATGAEVLSRARRVLADTDDLVREATQRAARAAARARLVRAGPAHPGLPAAVGRAAAGHRAAAGPDQRPDRRARRGRLPAGPAAPGAGPRPLRQRRRRPGAALPGRGRRRPVGPAAHASASARSASASSSSTSGPARPPWGSGRPATGPGPGPPPTSTTGSPRSPRAAAWG